MGRMPTIEQAKRDRKCYYTGRPIKKGEWCFVMEFTYKDRKSVCKETVNELHEMLCGN
jgi:hypothetical protein